MNNTHQLIQELLQALENGPCPSTRQLIDLAYALEGAMCAADLPEMLWMHVTFGDVADALVVAEKLVQNSDEEAAHDVATNGRVFKDDLSDIREAGL